MNNLKAAIIMNVSAAGVITNAVVSDEGKVRFVISNAGGGNTITVKGRITGQDDLDLLATLTGNNKTVVDVTTYDQIVVECTVYSSLTNYIKVVASSFNEASGSTTIDAPTGGPVSGSTINFTSSDSSVTITGIPGTSTIDFMATGSGGLSKYVASFNNTSDWTLNGSNYEYTVLAATHGKTDPVIDTFETIAGTDSVIFPTILRNASNDIILQVTQVPDNRYTGKIIIL